MADIFICYCRKDTKATTRLVDQLKAKGFSVWMDLSNVDGATLWAQEIVQAIDQCRVLIVMLSKDSVDSHNVVKEVSLASEKRKHILPLKLEEVRIPPTMQYQLANIHFLELYHGDKQEYFEQVVRALSHLGVLPAAPVAEADADVAPAEPPAPPVIEKKPKLWSRLRRNALALYDLAVPAAAKVRSQLEKLPKKARIAVLGTAAALLLLLIVWAAWPGEKGTGKSAAGLEREALPLATQKLEVVWQKGGLLGPKKTFYGTAGLFSAKNGKLYMVTSSRTLGLDALRKADVNPPVEVKQFGMWITFPSGTYREISRFADRVGGLDLAVLEMDGRNIVPGRDYVLLPYRSRQTLAEGEDVLLVRNSPRIGSTNIETPQKITAVQPIGPGGLMGYRVGDPAVGGKADGLLFKEYSGEFFWVGAIAAGMQDAQSQVVSIYAIQPAEFMKIKYKLYPCNSQGAAQALSELYNVEARAVE